jgi:8-oxo-dGTP pyrophosphatase MutT (NUDIX family)
MTHIHTEPYQHDLTASGYIFRIDSEEPQILLHHHIKLGSYMQFGGHVEHDEHPWHAVAREIREESGYDFDQLEVLQPRERIRTIHDIIVLPQPVFIIDVTYGKKTDHLHDDIGWAFVTREVPRHQPEANESRDIRLFTRSQLMGSEGETVLPNVREIALAIFDTYLSSWEAVPAKPLTREHE